MRIILFLLLVLSTALAWAEWVAVHVPRNRWLIAKVLHQNLGPKHDRDGYASNQQSCESSEQWIRDQRVRRVHNGALLISSYPLPVY